MTDAVATAQRLFQAFGQGDMAVVNTIMADDLTFELGGKSRFAGRAEGRDNVLALFGDLMGSLQISNDVVGMYPTDAGVIVHQRGHGKDGYTDESLLLMSVSDGRITAIKEFLFDTDPLDRLAPR